MKTLKRILALLRPYSPLVVISFIFAAMSVALTLAIPILAGSAIDLLAGVGKVDFSLLYTACGKIAFCALALALCDWVLSVLCNRISFLTVRDLRSLAFDKITRLPLSYLDTHPAGQTLNRVIADADQFSDGLLMGFRQLFTGVLTVVGTLVIMFKTSASVAAVVVLVTPVSLVSAWVLARRTYKYFREQTDARSNQTSVIAEMIGERKTVIALGMEKKANDTFCTSNDELRHASLLATFFSSIVNPTTRFINNTVYALSALFGSIAVMGTGSLTIGGLSCMLSYATQYSKPFNEISGVVTELQNAFACADNIFRLLDSPDRAPDGTAELESIDGRVAFDSVSFSYTKEKKLIEDLNLSVEPGMHVAIVGPTGCGKTTLINLLMRFYDTDAGSVSVDGKDIRTLTRKSLRTSYGMVLQDTWLRAGTVRDNIIMGKPDATDDEVIAAAKASHAHSFIRRLPQGYDTVIGEDGGNLSAGQKQLLCITRVMLCLPPMLILDEATSSIDTRTEQRIKKAFDTMMVGRTSFVVAHRLSTIENSDLILVMREGRVVESGTHSSLLEKNGFYAELYNSQFAHRQ